MRRHLLTAFGLVTVGVLFLGSIQIWHSIGHSVDIWTLSRDKSVVCTRSCHARAAEKFEAAGIEVATTCSQRELRSHRTVAGRIEYNAPRHVLVKSPFDGLIRRIDVKVGDRVTEGQVMGIVDSPELGERRADVLLRQSDLEQATNEHDWWHAIQSNLDELVILLKRPQPVSRLEKDFEDKPLGDYRQQILGAYSRMRLDEELSAVKTRRGKRRHQQTGQAGTRRRARHDIRQVCSGLRTGDVRCQANSPPRQNPR